MHRTQRVGLDPLECPRRHQSTDCSITRDPAEVESSLHRLLITSARFDADHLPTHLPRSRHGCEQFAVIGLVAGQEADAAGISATHYDASMDTVMALLGGLAGGGVLGAAIMAIFAGRSRRQLHRDHDMAIARAESLEDQSRQVLDELASLRSELADVNNRREVAERSVASQQERIAALEQAEHRLKETFALTSSEALKASNEQFLSLAQERFGKLMEQAKGDAQQRHQAIDNLVKPVRELLQKHGDAITEIEKNRATAYKQLEVQIKQIADSHDKLNTQTNRLVSALRRPEARGQWGEMQLRNAVELAGMTKHCDFHEQPQTDDPDTRDRPDMIVHMPGGGVIVVDAKVALDAYLDAMQPDAPRIDLLKRHTDQVKSHYQRLATKQYWNQFDRTPKLVVMFMPLESALVAALEHRPEMHSDAMANNVLIATPTLLIALLRAVAYGWQQESVAENARAIAQTGRELHERIGTFVNHLGKVGDSLQRSTSAYNAAVGSLEARVIPSTRKLRELGATNDDEHEPPRILDVTPRSLAERRNEEITGN